MYLLFRCLGDVFASTSTLYTLCLISIILIHIKTFVFRSFISTLMISNVHYHHLQHLITFIFIWTNDKKFISELNLSCSSPRLVQVKAFSLLCKLRVLGIFWSVIKNIFLFLRMTIKCRLYKSYVLFKNEFVGVSSPALPQLNLDIE